MKCKCRQFQHISVQCSVHTFLSKDFGLLTFLTHLWKLTKMNNQIFAYVHIYKLHAGCTKFLSGFWKVVSFPFQYINYNFKTTSVPCFSNQWSCVLYNSTVPSHCSNIGWSHLCYIYSCPWQLNDLTLFIQE